MTHTSLPWLLLFVIVYALLTACVKVTKFISGE